MKKRSYPLVLSFLPKIFGALLAAAVVMGFGLTGASAAANGRLPTRLAWRHQMQHLVVPAKGCFTGSYPTPKWHQVQCHTAPRIPFAPGIVSHNGVPSGIGSAAADAAGPGQEIGNGADYSAKVASGSISTATGSFPYVSPGSTETGEQDGTGPQVANTFSLQLNTEFFSGSPACAGAADPADCLAWQQFVYSSTSDAVFMQYWLIDYDAACPAGWFTYSTDCYENSAETLLTAAAPTIATLESVSLTGTVDSGGSDSVVMAYGSNSVSAVGADSVVDLAGNWNIAEFAILGDGDSTEANFSSGTTVDVETAVNNGATAAPTCDYDGFTAETNNLSFASAPALAAGSEPAIETQQTSAGGTAGCATAGAQANKVTVTSPGNQTSTVGTPVSLQMRASDSASGQTLTWSATGLPAGLSISSSGLISGTPTTPGTSSVKVTAKDTTGASGSASFTWTVNSSTTHKDKVTVRRPGNQTSTVGMPVRLRLKATDSARGQKLSWSATGLPAGLSISRWGLITGRPTTPGTSSVTVTATDRTGASGSATFTWTVRPRHRRHRATR